MKSKIWRIWLAAILLFGLSASPALAAEVDLTAPYNGEYFIAYNGHVLGSDKMASGDMPSVLALDEATSDMLPNVLQRHEEGGRTIYGIEPQNLDNITTVIRNYANRETNTAPPQYGDERTFFAIDYKNDAYVETEFVLKYSGQYCNVWLEKDDARNITDEIVTELGAEYDAKIHLPEQEAFGPIYDRDGDGKTAILLYDIKDSYPETDFFVAGLFAPIDLLSDTTNKMDLIHIDTYPAITSTGDLSGVKGTLVHELQHLIESSYCATAHVSSLPDWVNEGLSMSAEHLIYGPQADRISCYMSDYQPGMSLTEFSDDDPLPHYALYYLFMQYLRVQTKDLAGGGEALFPYIIQSDMRNGLCVQEAMRQFNPYTSIDDLLLDFYIALTLNESSGPHGFRGESAFSVIRPKLYTGTDSVRIGPGAALIKHTRVSNYTPSRNSNISYAAFSPNVNAISPPRSNPEGGEWYQFKTVSLSCREPNATIYYTVDGTTPNESSLIYTGKPIQLIFDTTIKAVTITNSGQKSSVSEYYYLPIKEDVELFRRMIGPYTFYGARAGMSRAVAVAAALDGSGLVEAGTLYIGDFGGEDTAELNPYDKFGSSYFSEEGYVVKYGFDGQQQWIRNIGGAYNITAINSIIAQEDGYIAVGYLQRNAADIAHSGDFEGIPVAEGEGLYTGIIVKLDLDGNIMWTQTLPDFGMLNKFVPCADGSFVIAGQGKYENYQKCEYAVAKIDALGNKLWYKVLSGIGNNRCSDIAVLTDGTVVTVGYVDGADLDGGLWADSAPNGVTFTVGKQYSVVAALRSDGELLWRQVFDADSVGAFTNVAVLPDGGFAAVGYLGDTFGYNSNALDGAIACFDADGTQRWSSVFDGSDPAAAGVIQATETDFKFFDVIAAEDGVMAFLNCDSKNNMFEKCRVTAVKYNMEGGIDWMQHYTSHYKESQKVAYVGNDAAAIGEREYAVCGHTSSMSLDEGYINGHPFLFTLYDESMPYYDVSGNVGLPGVKVGKKRSDSQGNYNLRVMQGKSVTITPELAGYTFAPEKITVGPVAANTPGNDFTPTEITYTLSGKILDKNGSPLAGVNVGGTQTAADGTYTVRVRPGVNVTLTPALDDKTFEPAVRMLTLISEDMSGLDFQEIKNKYTVSGTVTRDGNPQGGVKIGGTVTAPDGTYSLQVDEGSDLLLVPDFQHYIFTPQEIRLTNITENKSGQDFTMARIPAELQLSEESLTFGAVMVEYDPIDAVAVNVKNTGGTAVTGLAVSLPADSKFEVTPFATGDLAIGGTAEFTVKPQDGLAVGTYTDTVTVSDGAGQTATVAVTFEVTAAPPAELQLSQNAKDFGSQTVGYSPVNAVTVSVKNIGGTAVTGLTVSLPTDSKFEVTPFAAGDLAIGGTVDFTVKPKDGLAVGKYTDTVTVSDGAGHTATVAVTFEVTAKSPGSSSGSSHGGSKKPAKPAEPTEPIEAAEPAGQHTAYMTGYVDGSFRPEDKLTREQCVAIIARLDDDFDADKSYLPAVKFTDVRLKLWSANYIGFAAEKGIAAGYVNGEFRPDAYITRAEFASLLVKVLQLQDKAGETFPDVDDNWAAVSIGKLAKAGYLSGYPDGTFRPDNYITRAEAVKVFNRAYDRAPQTKPAADKPDMPFADVSAAHWAYDEIFEAAVEHDIALYHRK